MAERCLTSRYRRREHLLVAMLRHLPASELERWHFSRLNSRNSFYNMPPILRRVDQNKVHHFLLGLMSG
jgi:hypothetical protein